MIENMCTAHLSAHLSFNIQENTYSIDRNMCSRTFHSLKDSMSLEGCLSASGTNGRWSWPRTVFGCFFTLGRRARDGRRLLKQWEGSRIICANGGRTAALSQKGRRRSDAGTYKRENYIISGSNIFFDPQCTGILRIWSVQHYLVVPPPPTKIRQESNSKT